MLKSQVHPFPFSSIPKKKTLGMDGMNEIFMSIRIFSIHSGNCGNGWEWMGMDEKSKPKREVSHD
ncbi:MAG: hypothetical protein JZU64_04655 [Rhodoferax sp.]|jgi:hypothetical protein|nr:hypothetical protein [Rhodoferax sp.]